MYLQICTCNNCGSNDLRIEKEYDEEFEYIKDETNPDISGHILNKRLVDCEARVYYVCNSCGNKQLIY